MTHTAPRPRPARPIAAGLVRRWLSKDRRYHRAGDRNPATLTGTYHAFDLDPVESAARDRTFNHNTLTSLCGRVTMHVPWSHVLTTPPQRGPLGGKPSICRPCLVEALGLSLDSIEGALRA